MRMFLRAFSIGMFFAGPLVYAATADLSSVRSLYVNVDARPERLAEIMRTVSDIVSVRIADSPESADVVVAYSEVVSSGTWSATLYRLDCQSLDFNEPPSRSANGRCERNVFVRINLGTLRRTVTHGRSPDEELAFGLRDAILGIEPQPEEQEPPSPVFEMTLSQPSLSIPPEIVEELSPRPDVMFVESEWEPEEAEP